MQSLARMIPGYSQPAIRRLPHGIIREDQGGLKFAGLVFQIPISAKIRVTCFVHAGRHVCTCVLRQSTHCLPTQIALPEIQ